LLVKRFFYFPTYLKAERVQLNLAHVAKNKTNVKETKTNKQTTCAQYCNSKSNICEDNPKSK